jgi:hypothetical protein
VYLAILLVTEYRQHNTRLRLLTFGNPKPQAFVYKVIFVQMSV